MRTPTSLRPVLSACVFAVCMVLSAHATPGDPSRWEDEIASIETRDAGSPPPREGIVFVGSSSIRLWDLPKSFPDRRVVNHGFGGSQLCHSVHFFDRLVTPLRPHTVVLYAGDNDIAAGKSPEQVHQDFQAFVAKLHEALPETRLVYIAIKPSLARWKLADKIRAANSLILDSSHDDALVTYLDVWPAMLGDDGKPRKELFREDGLHLNEAGYGLWNEQLRPQLKLSRKP